MTVKYLFKKNMFLDFINDYKKVFHSFLVKIFGVIVNLIFFYTAAKLLTLEDFGNFQFLMSASIFLITFLTFGLDHKLFSIASSNLNNNPQKVSEDFVTSIIFVNSILLLLLFIVLIYINLNLITLFDINLKTINTYLMALPFIVTSSILFNFLNGCKKNKTYIFFSGPFQNLIFLFLVFTSFFGFTLQQFIICYLISVSVNFLILVYISRGFLGSTKVKLKRFFYLISKSFNLYIYYILTTIVVSFDIYFIKFFASEHELGLYAFASRFALLISVFFTTSSMFVMPRLVKMYKDGDYEELKRTYYFSSLLIILILLIPFCILIIYAQEIITFFFPSFFDSILSIKILLTAQFIGLIFGPNALLLFYTQNNHKLFLCTILSFISYIFLAYYFFNYLGINGVALSFLIYVIIWKLSTSIYFMKVFGFYPISFFNKNKVSV